MRIEDLRDVSFDLRDVSSLVFSDDTCGNFFFGKMAHTLLLPGADRYENLIYISLDYVEEEDDPTQIADTLVHELAHDYVDEKTHGGAWETNYEAWRSAIFEDIAVWEVRMRQVMSNIFDFLVDAVPDIVTDILSGNAPDVSKDE